MLKIHGIEDISDMPQTISESEFNPSLLKETVSKKLNTEVTVERNGDEVLVRRLLRD